MAVVGCASHSYTVTDRDGVLLAGTGVLTSVEYNRILNDVSSASATIAVTSPDCCTQLSGIRSWRHLLNIYRGRDLMWTGFILTVDWTNDAVKIQAVDIIGLLDRRVPHQTFNFEDADLSNIAATIINDGLAPDDPGHEVTVLGASGVLGGRAYAENVGQVGDHLRDLADTGIDFTAVGTNILVLPDDFCEVVGMLSDADLPEGLSVSEDGASLATRQIVAGAEEIIGTDGGINDYYGLLELYEEQSNITTETAAIMAARARRRSSSRVPVVIDTQNITLAPSANVDVRSLIPGWCVDVTSQKTCRDISQRLKITGLQVQEDGGSEATPGQERILLQLSATGEPLETM